MLAAAFIGCFWLNQGPSPKRYESLVLEARGKSEPMLRAWLPLAFLYRRSTDVELYYAVASAVLGRPFDAVLLREKRGPSSEHFRKLPEADGKWHMPYAEVPLEYPPLVLPFILVPALLSPSLDAFGRLFGVLMGGLALASLALGIQANAPATAAGRSRLGWLGSALFLAQGGLLVQRLDAIAALFLSLSLWAVATRRWGLFGSAMGLAAAAKIAPILILPPMLAAAREARSTAAVARVAAGVAGGIAAGFGPMLALSPTGIDEFFRYHAARGLMIESTYGAVISLVDLVRGTPSAATLSYGSYNLGGHVEDILAALSTPALFVAVGLLTAWCMRAAVARTNDPLGVVAWSGLSALLAIWLLGKVFSPQYLTWGIPFVAATQGKRTSRLVPWLIVLAMALTQTYLRGFYDLVVAMRPLGVAALATRTLVLVLAFVGVMRALAPKPAPGAGDLEATHP
jgi:hypothetical protein